MFYKGTLDQIVKKKTLKNVPFFKPAENAVKTCILENKIMAIYVVVDA